MKRSVAALVAVALTASLAPNGVAGPLPSSPVEPAPAAGASGAPTEAPKIESFPVRGSGIERVRATVAVNAPVDRVRGVLFDYARYPEFVPRYEKATVISITPEGARLVQMELGGIVRLWMRVQISPPAYRGTTEGYEGRLVMGNIKAFQPRWELEPLGSGRTRLTLESYLDPDLALVPDSLVNSGARDGIRDAILALKARSEGRVAAR
jgi:ribosome-associated toxin RatA of RatAB toxin-antitoxin module